MSSFERDINPEQDKDVVDEETRLSNRIRTVVTCPDGVTRITVSTVALLGYEKHAVYETYLYSINARGWQPHVAERCETFAERRAMHDKWCKMVKEQGVECIKKDD